jgi:hypothetical protein
MTEAKKKAMSPKEHTQYDLFDHLVRIISSTNGISLQETLELATNSASLKRKPRAYALLTEFRQLLSQFQQYSEDIDALLDHPVGRTLHEFFRQFPIPYRDEHMHLTGSLTPDFIYTHLKPLLEGSGAALYAQRIEEAYGKGSPPKSTEDVRSLVTMPEGEGLIRYLEILLLPKLFLKDRNAHREAALHMAKEVYENFNVGKVRLKFTFSRITKMKTEEVPGLKESTSEEALLGLYEGFMEFKKQHPFFEFILSPSFKKEEEFYDTERFQSKSEDFMHQVNSILTLLEKYPELRPYVVDVDTVGDDRNLYRKAHFFPMQPGFHKLHQHGFKIRSHHGETWHTLNQGIQSVDNAMNIWHIDTLEHGLSLGINPNYYFHQIFETARKLNSKGTAVLPESAEGKELAHIDWAGNETILKKITRGKPLTAADVTHFARIKSSHAMEVEYYQHDVLNHMIDKGVGLTSLPSSNKKLSGAIADYKNHPFSWWEKKEVKQAIGTDNYITLDTNFIREMIILLLSDPKNLKITKLLMVATGEERRPYLSKNLWDMRKLLKKEFA